MPRPRDRATADLFAPLSAPPPLTASTPLVDVAVPVPIDKLFTYILPENMVDRAREGARVLVPFGGRRVMGVVLGTRMHDPDAPRDDVARLKSILAVVDAQPVLPPELLAFLREVASYYLAPIGEVTALALPAVDRTTIRRLRAEGVHPAAATRVAPEHVERVVRATGQTTIGNRRLGATQKAILEALSSGESTMRALTEKWPSAGQATKKLAALGLVEIEERKIDVSPFASSSERDAPPELTDEQRAVLSPMLEAISTGNSRSFLLQGVTGSGKTEVYLRAIRETLSRGRGALVLVPEIALTPQFVARFRARFGDDVAVVHSALDPAARHAMWRKLREGSLRVAIGARSALFAPVPSLGLVVVDEEHDPSFKQEDGVRYHGRDCAILRAHRAGAVCILGSATPSLESIELARRNKVVHLRMHRRARTQPLPEVETIDLRHVGAGPSNSRLLTLPLHRALEETLAAKEQAILFLNRRGFAPAVICGQCGDLRRCPDCDVALTMHRHRGLRPVHGGGVATVPAGMRCHYCDRVEPPPPGMRCPKCRGPLELEGVGTEQLEEILAASFPHARIARLDRDVAGARDVEAVLAKMRAREIDVLVGTQMVTKGHDLPFVTLVGVINADGALSMPDFRAAERTFHLLVQVAGRAGRGDARGRVLVQTRSPRHAAIECAVHHDVDAFVERELRDRRELGYPPFSRLVLLRIDGANEARTIEAAQTLVDAALAAPEAKSSSVEVRGPSPAPVPRVRGRFRWRVLLRGDRKSVRAAALAVRSMLANVPRDVRVVVDVDPLSMM